MTKKPLKSWRTLASESKARRKTKLTPAQIKKLNKVFVEIEEEWAQLNKRKISSPAKSGVLRLKIGLFAVAELIKSHCEQRIIQP